jgi:hypothetical protein
LRATEAAGSLKSFEWSATLNSSVTAQQGGATDCDATATASAYAVFNTITIAKPQWLELSGELDEGLSTIIVFTRTSPASPPWSQTMVLTGAHSQTDWDFLLRAGTYTATIVSSAPAAAPGGSNPTSRQGDVALKGTLVPAGTATNKATGAGTKYLSFDKARKCAANQLKAKFKPAAGDGPNAKIKKATFFANGDKVKTVGLPIRGDRVTLTDLPSAEEVIVKVRLKLFGDGAVTASRSYLSCT